MDWTIILSFIRPELSILIVFLWCLGLFLKKLPQLKADYLIPFILLGTSLVVTIPYVAIVCGAGFSASVFISGIIQATIIASVSVFGNEIIKQLTVKRFDDESK